MHLWDPILSNSLNVVNNLYIYFHFYFTTMYTLGTIFFTIRFPLSWTLSRFITNSYSLSWYYLKLFHMLIKFTLCCNNTQTKTSIKFSLFCNTEDIICTLRAAHRIVYLNVKLRKIKFTFWTIKWNWFTQVFSLAYFCINISKLSKVNYTSRTDVITKKPLINIFLQEL